ncbi:hypothetical protein [Antarcticirhabdus aurantiaca]|uniref:Uncharacterized protein n=1 Tax=Antarcticirhabdus aurantiaca TaxID=2606717 RepID=A0ACD4NRQ0_9HYPH|nr:hypothetical protein OXU80_03590 [Jeongeuplla avenae]
MLPAWDDEAIMNCDMARLAIAVEAAGDRLQQDRRFQIMLAGGEPEDDVDVPDEPDTDEAFNSKLAGFLSAWKAS